MYRSVIGYFNVFKQRGWQHFLASTPRHIVCRSKYVRIYRLPGTKNALYHQIKACSCNCSKGSRSSHPHTVGIPEFHYHYCQVPINPSDLNFTKFSQNPEGNARESLSIHNNRSDSEVSLRKDRLYSGGRPIRVCTILYRESNKLLPSVRVKTSIYILSKGGIRIKIRFLRHLSTASDAW
jgi:hypothetical protein